MININFTLFIQLANFLILMVILNYLLFRPILRVLDEREKLVKDSTEIKERLDTLAGDGITRYERELMDAKQRAMSLRTSVRSEVMTEYKKQILQTKESGMKELDKARQEISVEAEKSRETLMREAEAIAGEIASKLVGRTL